MSKDEESDQKTLELSAAHVAVLFLRDVGVSYHMPFPASSGSAGVGAVDCVIDTKCSGVARSTVYGLSA
jgi:hypothetical protein